jgi:hypothetical protein
MNDELGRNGADGELASSLFIVPRSALIAISTT